MSNPSPQQPSTVAEIVKKISKYNHTDCGDKDCPFLVEAIAAINELARTEIRQVLDRLLEKETTIFLPDDYLEDSWTAVSVSAIAAEKERLNEPE